MMSATSIFTVLLLVAAQAASASTTKVGNGDDGRDLEGGEKIESGILVETQKEAANLCRALNIPGIQGLGMVLPEIERAELILVKQDVKPLTSDGSWEKSDDGKEVFARTFAEPHAPTRFFPAALKLSRAQLVSLHTHEALHRALPSGVREDEEKVSYLTMAITSPHASFDRVNRVAQDILKPQVAPALSAQPAPPASTMATNYVEVRPLRKPTEASLRLMHTLHMTSETPQHIEPIPQLGLTFSPFDTFAVGKNSGELLVSADALLLQRPEGGGYYGGPISFAAKAPVHFSEHRSAGLMARVSLKAVESPSYAEYGRLPRDRDVYTVGAFIQNEAPYTYGGAELTYTLPGAYMNPGEYDYGGGTYIPEELVRVEPIWTARLNRGFKFRRFSLGGGAEIHHMSKASRTTQLRAGPEIKFTTSFVTVSLAGKWGVGDGVHLEEMADIVGHGSLTNSASLSLEFGL